MGKKKGGGGGGKPKRDLWEDDMREIAQAAASPEQLAAAKAAAEAAAAADAAKQAEAWANRKFRLVVSEVSGEGAGRKKHRVEVKASDSLSILGASIAETTGIAVADQVIIFKGKLLDTTADGDNGVADAQLSNQCKMSLMTRANAALAAAAPSQSEKQEAILLVAIEVESEVLASHRAKLDEAGATLDVTVTAMAQPAAADNVNVAAAVAACSKARQQHGTHVSLIEKLQVRLDSFQIAKSQAGPRDARKALISQSTKVLEEADAVTARFKKALALLDHLSEVHGLLSEYPPDHAGRAELDASMAEVMGKLTVL
mmetsp:Transcript_29678/g.77838  ORF Transcript_29678/g.77838 Transcript_29678/m.77838 type:complete len:315 (+) Transcript_29678:87-1031(+)